ncbi:MAG: hypothetical protein HOW73_31315 [Polyangiaceae bacterium]|nr:hypothetical protein [Polyangiaceae bacterium]
MLSGVCAGVILTGSLLDATAAHAAGTQLRIDKVEKAPVIDGVPKEWPRELSKLTSAVKGSPSATDLSAKGVIAYDDKNLYVAVDVTDDTLVGGGSDRVDLVLAFGSGAQTVSIFPGQPGKSAGKATAKGSAITGAKVVEAPRKGGWSLEASIPWSAFDGAASQRVDLKGGLFVHDVDASAVEATVGTASGMDASSLGQVLTTPEQALVDGLVKDKKLGAPTFAGLANVVGDAQKERVLVFGSHLVVLGPTYRSGKEYWFSDMAVGGMSMNILSTELRDVDGDGKEDIVFKKRFLKSGAKTSREVLQVYSYGAADAPELVFRHEVGISNAKGSVTNDVSFGSDGGKPTIVIKPGSAKGLDDQSYDEPTESSYDPLLLPWGTIESQTYKAKGKSFGKTEKTRPKPVSAEPAKTAPKPATAAPAAPAPAKPDTAKVYATYKKDRGISGAARFDLNGDVAEDTKTERVVVHDKEIAVFGPGFKGGDKYVFTQLAFANASDIKSVSLQDVTGDKKAEVVVRGVLKSKGPNKEDVEREVELVYRVTAEGLKRVFAAEVGRAIGSKKIIGAIAYDSGKVTLSAGKAVGFTKDTYPFAQDSSAVGGFEPLILPWGDAKPLKYKWSGSGFDKQ